MLIALAFAQGGYHPATWARATVCLLCVAAVGFWLRPRITLSCQELVVLAALASLVALVSLSVVWSAAPNSSLQEGKRALLYLAGFGACLLTRPGRRSVILALAAALASVVAVATLHELLLGRPGSGPLAWPVGYANSLGILAAVALLLCVEVASSERAWLRSLAFAGLALLPAGLLLTSSRGAWLALAVGLVMRCGLETNRPRFFGTIGASVIPAGAAAWVAARWDQAHTPHSVWAAALVLIAVLGAVLAPSAADRLERFRSPGRIAFAAALGCVAAVIVLSPTNPFGEQRPYYWAAAWHDYQSHPFLGSGAGTYALSWHAERPLPVNVQDAHSLYLETLAEVGPFGLLLMLTVFGLPLLVALRNRDSPIVTAAAPAYVAFVLHAGIDWDWEMPVVTLAALACGALLLRSAEPGRAR